jgi:CheY-like chemotaxis protein
LNQRTDKRKLLVLLSANLQSDPIMDSLRECYDIHECGDLKAALDAMRTDVYDAILAETGNFLPVERGMAFHQSSAILDTLGEGICVVNRAGELVWANQRLGKFPEPVTRQLLGVCAEAMEDFREQPFPGKVRSRHFSLIPGDGSYYEVVCSPVRDPQGTVRQIAAVVMDATHRRRQQATRRALEKLGQELTQLVPPKAGLDRKARIRLLNDRLLRHGRDVLAFQHVGIMLTDPRTNRLRWLLSEGLELGVLQQELFVGVEGNGICGYVAATGHSYLCRDIASDHRYRAGLTNAHSSLTVPLRLGEQIVGVLNMESVQWAAFDEDDRRFAETFADNVSVGMGLLGLLDPTGDSRVDASQGDSLRHLSEAVSTQALEIMEDYIGYDDLRHRLQKVVDLATSYRADPDQDQPRLQPAVSGHLKGRRVLVVDDEQMILAIIQSALKPEGCQIERAENGQAAIDLIDRNRYDLIISDIRMPVASGYRVLEAAARGGMKVLLTTGFGYDPDHPTVQACRDHLVGVLFKPFSIKDLVNMVTDGLAGEVS